MSDLYIDGDFPTDTKCKYHCSPSCHPCQVGPEWVYGCTHPAWPANRCGDFCPIVECGGDPDKCDMRGMKFVGRYVGGLKRRISTVEKKAKIFSRQLEEVVELTAKRGDK